MVSCGISVFFSFPFFSAETRNTTMCWYCAIPTAAQKAQTYWLERGKECECWRSAVTAITLLFWLTYLLTFTESTSLFPSLSLPLWNCVKRQPGHSEGLPSNTKWLAGWWWWRDDRRKIRLIVPSEGPWMIYNTNWRLHERLGKLICTSLLLPQTLPRSLSTTPLFVVKRR